MKADIKNMLEELLYTTMNNFQTVKSQIVDLTRRVEEIERKLKEQDE